MPRADTSAYRDLLVGDTPLMDLRAPVEFVRGAFPCARNLPLMSDAERAQVGTCYKAQGQAAAITLGHRLVAGQTRDERMALWLDFARAHPAGYLYCFRGGLRSATVQQWLAGEGLHYPRVRGGYKALRGFLLEALPEVLHRQPARLVCGPTGSGKTRAIQAITRAVDLEGRAQHRGSAFGRLPAGQPSQIDFENALIIDLLKLDGPAGRPLYLEDEGPMIGSLNLPLALREAMCSAPLLLIDEPLEARVRVVLEDYIVDLGERYRQHFGPLEGERRHRQALLDALGRIQRRLGGVRHTQLRRDMEAAFVQQQRNADIEWHCGWIRGLLQNYYDPMYQYQLGKRDGQVLARASRAEIVDLAQAS